MSGQVVRHVLSPCALVRQFKLGAIPCAKASVDDSNANARAPAIFSIFIATSFLLSRSRRRRQPHAATWDASRQLEVFSRRREAMLKIKADSCLARDDGSSMKLPAALAPP